MEERPLPDDDTSDVPEDIPKRRKANKNPPASSLESESEDNERLFKARDSDLKRSDKPSSRKPLPPPDPMDENRESRMSDPSNDCI